MNFFNLITGAKNVILTNARDRHARLFASLAMTVLIAGSWLLVAGHASAQTSVDLGLSYATATGLTSTDVRTTIARVINVFLGLLGVLAVVLIIYAGFIWMTAGGNEEKVTKAKQFIINAIIGLAIILSAYAIVSFVINKLTEATLGVETSSSGGGGVGAGANAFQIASIQPVTPTTCPATLLSCSPKNSAVRITFNAALASGPSGLGNILVETIGRLQDAGGQMLSVPRPITPLPVVGSVTRDQKDNHVLIFTPQQSIGLLDGSGCATQPCFDPFSQIRVTVAPQSVAAVDGRNLSCNNGLCQQTFLVGNVLDMTPPTVRLITPANGDFVPGASGVPVAADARDDTAIAAVQFYADNVLLGVSTRAPYQVTWSTVGLALKSVHELKAVAIDVSNKSTTSGLVSVTIRAQHCFNRVKDADETGVDVGGADCGKAPGDSCTADSECWPGLCVNGVCKIAPVITALLPDNGKPGNLVTVFGRGFGSFAQGKSSLLFQGGTDTADDKLISSTPALPQACQENWWADQQIIVPVPAGAASGPLQVTNDAALSGISLIPFTINGIARPGLCAVNPTSGAFRDVATVTGLQFGSASPASQLFFGSVPTTVPATAWQDTTIAASVPNVQPGNRWLTVQVADQVSNPLTNFTVKQLVNGPLISEISPQPAPIGQYLTIVGQNFGVNQGKVWFQTAGNPVWSGPLDLAPACRAAFWKDNQIIAKVPAALRGQTTTQVWVERADQALSPLIALSIGGSPRPNLCRLEPDNGPAGLATVQFMGERFGTAVGKAKFFEGQDAPGLVDRTRAWQDGNAFALTPAAAKSGPVTLIDGAGTVSNALQFKVGACDANRSDSCPFKIDGTTRQQCCGDGSCRDSCGASGPNECTLTWSFTTGAGCAAGQVATANGCKTLQVVEDRECTLSAFQTSPSPYRDSVAACSNALVFARFNAKVAPVTANAVQVVQCTNASCSATTPVTGELEIVDYDQMSNGFQFTPITPSASLVPGAIYQVTLKSGPQGVVTLSGSQLDGNRNERLEASPADDYRYRFTIRGADFGPCVVSRVSVSPGSTTLVGPGQTQDYMGGLGSDNCNLLNPRSVTWVWSSDEVTKAAVAPSSRYKATATALDQTGAVPVHIKAATSGRSGSGDLFINFLPQVMQECNMGTACTASGANRLPSPSPSLVFGGGAAACTNALVNVKLTVPVEVATVNTNSVLVSRCTASGAIPCSVTSQVNANISMSVADEGGFPRTIINAVPATGTWPANTIFQVTLRDTIATTTGQKLDGDSDGIPGGDYKWIFTTSASICPIGCVNVSPSETTVRSYFPVVRFKALPSSQNDTCALVNPRSTEWSWGSSGNPPNYSGTAWTSLRFCSSDADCDGEVGACNRTTGFCPTYYGRSRPLTPTLSGKPHAVFATPASFSTQKGEAHMIIDFLPLRVAERWPNCNEACPNAAVGLKFNQPVTSVSVLQPWPAYLNSQGYVGTGGTLRLVPRIQLFKCADSNCRREQLIPLSDVAGLSLAGDKMTVTIQPKVALELGGIYQVLVLGGESGVRAVNARSAVFDPSVLNYSMYGSWPLDAYVWRFQMSSGVGAGECRISTVTINPDEASQPIYARQGFAAEPRTVPDSCDASGQRLDGYKFAWAWGSDYTPVATVSNVTGCGNGVVEYGESCDPGSRSVTWCSNKCLLTGVLANGDVCDDGAVGVSEQCDKINDVWLPGCNQATCLWQGQGSVPSSVCGNGVIDPGEACDDNNLINVDGCSDKCLLDGNPRTTVSPYQEAYALGGGTAHITAATAGVTGRGLFNVVETCESNLDCTAGPGRCSKSETSCQRNDQCATGETCERQGALACEGSVCTNYRCAPAIHSITPTDGAPGTWATIRGCKFGNQPGVVMHLGDTTIETDDKPALFPRDPQCDENWADEQIIIEVPDVSTTDTADDASSGPLKVITQSLDDTGTPLSVTSAQSFTVNNKVRPGICKLNPNNGVVGTPVGIIGQNFGDSRALGPDATNRTDDSRVFFGGLPLDTGALAATVDSMIRSWTNRLVQALVPDGVGTRRSVTDSSIQTQVRLLGGSSGSPAGSESNQVSFYLAPYITSITPAVGPVGSWVTIKGGNFGTEPGRVTLAGPGTARINADPLPSWCSTTWTDTEIVVKVPVGAVSDLVKVITAASVETKNENSKTFTVDNNLPLTPGLCSLIPATGSVGTVVRLQGDRFGNPQGDNDQVKFAQGRAATIVDTVTTIPIRVSGISGFQATKIAVPAPQTLWAFSYQGFVIRSDDQGQTWTRQPLNDSPKSLSVVSPTVAWEAGFYSVNRTVDGGETWQLVAGTMRDSDEIVGISATEAWLRKGATLYATQNGGQTFVSRGNLPVGTAANPFKIGSFAVLPGSDFDHTSIWMVGGTATGGKGQIWRSNNGGTSWQQQYQDANFGTSLQSLTVRSVNLAWVVGSSGTILKTTDGGTTWAIQATGATTFGNPNLQFLDVTALSDQVVWAASFRGLYKSKDGGATWSKISGVGSKNVYAVAGTSATDVWAAGTSNIGLYHVTEQGWTDNSISAVVPDGTVTGDVVVQRQISGPGTRYCSGVVILGRCYFGEAGTSDGWTTPTIINTLISNPKTFTVPGGGGSSGGTFTITGHAPDGDNACPNSAIYASPSATVNYSSMIGGNVTLERQQTAGNGTTSWVSANDKLGTRYYYGEATGGVRPICTTVGGCYINLYCDLNTGVCGRAQNGEDEDPVCRVNQGDDSCVGDPKVSSSALSQLPPRINLNLAEVLDTEATYRVTLRGGPDGLLASGVGRLASDVSWTFTTRNETCRPNTVLVTPDKWTVGREQFNASPTQVFEAATYLQESGSLIELASVPGTFDFSWVWSLDNSSLVGLSNYNGSRVTATLKNQTGTGGVANLTALAVVQGAAGFDIASQPVPIIAILCDNTWPAVTFPYTDASANCTLDTGSATVCPSFNFSTYYCRDGATMLPILLTPSVRGSWPDGSAPITSLLNKLLKEFYLATPADPVGKQDLISIRVYRNAQRLAPEDWYRVVVPNPGTPQSVTIDGYSAVRDGRTVYVSAQNIAITDVYPVVYVLSYNDTASQTTQNIFNQLLQNLKFNTNLASNMTGIFYRTTAPADVRSLWQSLRTDTRRIGDLQKLALKLGHCSLQTGWACWLKEDCGGAVGGACVGALPALSSGSFQTGMSVSTWPSWQGEFARELGGGPLPVDPKNGIQNCKACLGSGQPCQGDVQCNVKVCSLSRKICSVTADCPAREICTSRSCSVTQDRMCGSATDCPSGESCGLDACGTPPTLDVKACWESRAKQFSCRNSAITNPTTDDSFVYMFKSEGSKFPLRFNLESYKIPNGIRVPINWVNWIGATTVPGLPLPLSTATQPVNYACPYP